MATNYQEEKPVVTQPKSLSPEMLKTLETFEKMGAKPKAGSPEDLKKWMMDYLKSQGAFQEQKPTTDETPQLAKPPKPAKKTVTKMVMKHPSKITWFSGTEQNAGDTTFELWRHEVQCLLKQKYDKDAILNAVRRSLRGEAGFVAMRLELNATVHDIIKKLDSIYWSVDEKEELLAEFYGSRQRPDESVTAWSCRLEGIIGKSVDKGMIQQINTRLDINDKRWEEAPWNQQQSRQPPQWQPHRQPSWQPHRNTLPWQQQSQSPWQQQPHYRQELRHTGRNRGRGQNSNRGRDNQEKDYQCWRCGQMGHLKIGCKIRMDHSKQNLNSKKSMQGEHS